MRFGYLGGADKVKTTVINQPWRCKDRCNLRDPFWNHLQKVISQQTCSCDDETREQERWSYDRKPERLFKVRVYPLFLSTYHVSFCRANAVDWVFIVSSLPDDYLKSVVAKIILSCEPRRSLCILKVTTVHLVCNATMSYSVQ